MYTVFVLAPPATLAPLYSVIAFARADLVVQYGVDRWFHPPDMPTIVMVPATVDSL